MRNKKKVLHIIQSLGNGGWENALLRLLPLLADEFENHIITLRELGELAPKFSEKNISVTTVHWKGFFDIAGYERLFMEVRQFAPNVIITYLFHADAIGRLLLQKKVSAPIIPFLGTTYNHSKYWPARIFEKITKKYARQYLANSPAVENFYVNKIEVPKEKITTISTGVDVEFFNSIQPNSKLRETFGLNPDDFVIICVGNLHSNKGHRYLLEAFESLYSPNNETIPAINTLNLKLLLVGDGTERKNLEQQIESYQSKENIHFLGRRTDVPQLLKISDCFVLPTLFEGMSNAVMEAMAAGLPVITTDISENRELVENGKTGMLVPTKNTKEITTSVQILISNPEKRRFYGNAAKNFIQEHYSIRLSVDRFSHFLHSL